jgi:hypothetical protein
MGREDGMAGRGMKNRNISPDATFTHRPYSVCSGTVCENGDTYGFQVIADEGEQIVEVQAWAGTCVGGTTVNADVRKNGVSVLTAPMSFVTKQQTIIQGTLKTDTAAATRLTRGDICTVKLTRVGAGAFGQVMVVVKTRPLVGVETRL